MRATTGALLAIDVYSSSCVVGAADLAIDEAARKFEIDGRTVGEGDTISVDGGTGEVILDAIPTVEGNLDDELRELLGWADFYRKGGLGVRANADTPADAERARGFGAEGIGLVRTEHMPS